MEGYIDLKRLSLEELAGVVNLYPWFGAARKELCVRMLRAGGWSMEQYADAAMYLGSRRIISDMVRSESREDCSDRELEEMLRKVSNDYRPRQVRVSGGDYFTQEQYDLVRKDEDAAFADIVKSASVPSERRHDAADGPDLAFYTETLAQIYADQGYVEQARRIYSKLILAYPEKSAYFAALMENLNEEN